MRRNKYNQRTFTIFMLKIKKRLKKRKNKKKNLIKECED
jgi:hypothetical protein